VKVGGGAAAYDGHCGGTEWRACGFGVSRDGSMAEYFMVPDAKRNLAVFPEGIEDWAAVCATDTLPAETTARDRRRHP
jgi:threonine dehydrogenase-like Zn-dependent dehydrogenase